MTDKVIEYKSAQKTITERIKVLETSEKDGIVCLWKAKTTEVYYDEHELNFIWNLDWTKLKDEGVEKLTGFITLSSPEDDNFDDMEIVIDLEECPITVTEDFFVSESNISASFEYHLTPHYKKIEKVSYDEMFAASDKTDAILVIDEKKVHVNKAFLSFHSDFFTALFYSNFKEGQLTEIPIKDVSYEEFGMLLSTIYPMQVFPNDSSAAKLLELADRFLMPSVTHVVEHHLLEHSKLGNEKMMWMADAYGMQNLLEKCIRAMDTVEKAKALEKSEDYEKLSDSVMSKLFKRVLQLI